MPNIAALLKTEISRLAKKEVRQEVAPLRKLAASHRREIAQLKRTLAVLNRTTKQLAKPRAVAEIQTTVERPSRFVAKGLVSLRKRLGLSAAELARLLDVSMQSVYNWEHKKATPRKEQLAAIVALRSVGKKDALERLNAMQVRKATGNRRTKPRGTKERASGRTTPRAAKRARAK
jgi:DNA-binding transcriptional regulator YiaG